MRGSNARGRPGDGRRGRDSRRGRQVACHHSTHLLLAAAAAFVTSGLLEADTVRVPGEVATIQEALDGAGPGDVVLVAPGEYAIDEPIEPSRSVRGERRPVTLRSAGGPDRTVIRPSEAARHSGRGGIFLFQSAADRDVTVEGFTLTEGTGLELEGLLDEVGGAVVCRAGGSPTLIDCTITGNEVGVGMGGGVACLGAGTDPRFVDCRIDRNRAGSGGGITFFGGAAGGMERCLLSLNSAELGGALECLDSTPTLRRCTLVRNAAEGNGGAAYFGGDSGALIDCLIEGNHAQWAGAVWTSWSRATFRRCLVRGNRGLQSSGGFTFDWKSTPRLVNSIVVGNEGAAVVSDRGAHPRISSCVILGGSWLAVACAEGFPPEIVNSIIDLPARFLCGTVDHSLVGEDPLFVRPGTYDLERFVLVEIGGQERPMPDFVVEEGDYHLRADSPGVDAGTLRGAPSTDIDGEGRPCGDGIDIGPDETGGCAPPRETFLRGDADGGGRIDISDAIFLLRYLFLGGRAPGCLDAADVNDDGRLDVSDAVYDLSYLFLGGRAPELPWPECGIDEWLDELDCRDSPPGC